METKDLLKNTILTPIQSNVSNVQYPCTGFSYMVIQNIKQIIELYTERKEYEYYHFIENLIKQAGIRKGKNPNIDQTGEYINQPTVYADFGDICDKMIFNEFGTVNDEYGNMAINNIALGLFELEQYGFLIINRSLETFVLIKLADDCFLVVDSHKSVHGVVDFENATNYIMKNNNYQGVVQLGICKKWSI